MGNDSSKENEVNNEYITFESIHKYIGITDKMLFKNVFNRSSNKKKIF